MTAAPQAGGTESGVQVWPEPGRARVVDEAVLGPVRLRVIASDDDPAALHFSPVFAEGGDARRHADFDRAVVTAMRAGATLPTRAGHAVEFRGTPADYRGPLEFDPGWSSNSLSLMDLAGTAHVHKTYRRLTPGSREPGLLQTMAGSGRTQQFVGEYAYRRADGSRVPLGMIYVYADGDGLDVPLRQSLRSLWAALADGMPVDPAVSAVVAGLRRPLTDAGAFLRGFHGELAARLGRCDPFPVDDYLAAVDRRIFEVAAMIRADGRHPAAAGTAVVDALRAEWSRGAAASRHGWPAGASHGDLHLSHFLRAETSGGGWRMCLIDLSTPPLDPADPRHAAQSPWQDPAALLRGLDCFTGDEFAYQVGLDLGVDKYDACRTAYLRVAGLAPDTAGWTADRLAHLDRLRTAAATWRRQVGEALTRGYAPDGTAEEHPAWHVFQLARLLHDLAYAYTHDRSYYAAVTLRQALEMRLGKGAADDDADHRDLLRVRRV